MFGFISRPEVWILLFTVPFGGTPLMMGYQTRSEALFYYFRLSNLFRRSFEEIQP